MKKWDVVLSMTLVCGFSIEAPDEVSAVDEATRQMRNGVHIPTAMISGTVLDLESVQEAS